MWYSPVRVPSVCAEREQPSDFVFGLASTNIVEYVAFRGLEDRWRSFGLWTIGIVWHMSEWDRIAIYGRDSASDVTHSGKVAVAQSAQKRLEIEL